MTRKILKGFDEFLIMLNPLTFEHDKVNYQISKVESSLFKGFGPCSILGAGSTYNQTAIRHHSNNNIFIKIPSENLPICSNEALLILKETLLSTFNDNVKITINNMSVAIAFGVYASETLMITPSISNGLIQTSIGEVETIKIPKYDCDWDIISPKAYQDFLDKENLRLNLKLKPLIRLLKAWKFYNDVPINSFYLEMSLLRYVSAKNNIEYDIDICEYLQYLIKNQLAIIENLMGFSSIITNYRTKTEKENILAEINVGFKRAKKAVENRHVPNYCFYYWDVFLIMNFLLSENDYFIGIGFNF